ncbi:MAG: M48 family metallopeptidase [Simkania sp.]|nr:M48 family metallopeptidase [Simkania sp.]
MKKFFVLVFLLMGVTVWGECPVIPTPVPAPTEAAVSFYKSGNVLWGIKALWSLVLPAVILFTGLSAKMRQFSRFLGRRAVWTFIIFIILYSILVEIVSFPLTYYSGFARLHEYGLSSQSFGRWFNHYFMSSWIDMGTSLIVFGVLYWLIAKSPKRWWLYMGLLMIPIQIFFQIVQPLYISPLFNKFGPMEDKQLEQKILNLAEKAGISESRVFEVDKSSDTKMMNAYVTGMGASKRIVLWDTIIKGMDEKELLFVMGHEMGHYVLHHIWWGILFTSGMAILVMALIFLASKFFLKTCSKTMGFTELKDVASFPLIMLLYGFFSLVFTPVQNLFSQMEEREADRFGLEITHYNHGAATGFLKLTSSNLGYPYPGTFYMLFRSSHPSIGSRIEFFNTYHPWCSGKPSHYQKYFKQGTETDTP